MHSASGAIRLSRPMQHRVSSLAVLVPFLFACNSAGPRSEAPAAPHAAAAEPGARATSGSHQEPQSPAESRYTLVLIRTGPKSGQLPAEDEQHAFEGHFANMARMAREGELVLAGPFGDVRHAPDLRGIFVLATGERAEAETWAGTDPTTRAGVFRLEFHDLATGAALRRACEEDLAWHDRQVAEGKTPKPGENGRGYALLTVEHADVAWRELAPLQTAEGGVLFLARLDGTRALALLDTANAAEARERFAPQLEALGACTLDDWFGSAEFARLPELARN